MKKDELSLADLVHGMTFARKIGGELVTDAGKRVLQVYRAKLKQAERFTVADDSVRLVCHLAHEHDRLEGWSFLARLPYSPCWFELNLHEKVREFRRMGTLTSKEDLDNVPRRMGLLLWRDSLGDDDKNPRWMMHVFIESPQGEIMPELISYIFDPEGNPMWPVRGSQFWRKPTLSLRPDCPKISVAVHAMKDRDGEAVVKTLVDPEIILGGLLGAGGGSFPVTSNDGKYTFMHIPEEGDAADMVTGPEWLVPRMAAIVEPWSEITFGKAIVDRPKVWRHMLEYHVRENAGHLRWVLAMLAAINGIPKSIRPLPARTGKRSMGMYRLAYFSQSIVELTIPAEDKILYARSKLNKAASNVHRPWHKVRGHWRIIERGKRQYICRHDPVMVESGLGMCSKCQLLVRWISDFWQGTPEEGIHSHTYEVKT